MTIISDLTQHAAQKKTQARSTTNGVSFAKRIEAGGSARQITQDRALGFSETGLLGLHYAHNFSNKIMGRPAPSNLLATVTNPAAVNSIPVPEEFGVQSSSNVQKFRITQVQESANEATTPKDTFKNDFICEITPLPFVLMSTDVADTPAQLKPVILNAFEQAILRRSTETRLALRVVETLQGISVICDAEMVSSNDVIEFTDIANKVAMDFGVTVRRLVVNRYESI
jgi:hypothetical protein